ncbi:uroporphyrinogen decarboxylase [Methylotenera oryzisoli]|jgi:uroporphyrinogen decarboxylase|uniref:Uroporphyrinogen decarboxylase n=1 Tax=Methylotenera oryzisoli TaxID=2080758 RepID=A0A4Y9VUK8_9PROT|nr:uroporphyrinogen decarboxylase [Methylotenera oryzisoli]TFW72576.1 uroporphyrinogen decarboxylase [Methylotenera oryzisoli]
MNQLKNDTFLKALMRQPTDYTPVWMMRQAGRYLPEYRESRKTAGSFLQLCKNAQFATDVTLQPLDRYPLLDAAILFSDILTVPDAMGLGLYFEEGEGPKFERTLQQEADIQKLVVPDMAKLQYVFDAVSSIRQALDGRVPLIGFSGSPWTLATYMVEGKGGTDFLTTKKMAYARPDLLHHILETTAQTVIQYLNAQIMAGAQAVMIFDSWGGALSHNAYTEFSLNYMQKIVNGLIKTNDGRKVPSIVFTKGGGLWLEAQAGIGSDALGLDWTVDIGSARQRVGDKVALQGNLDPAILLSTPEAIEKEVISVLASYGKGHGHVFNLGHGITQWTPPENAAAMLTAIRAHSQQYHV